MRGGWLVTEFQIVNDWERVPWRVPQRIPLRIPQRTPLRVTRRVPILGLSPEQSLSGPTDIQMDHSNGSLKLLIIRLTEIMHLDKR